MHLLDGDEAQTDLRKQTLHISSGFNVVVTEAVEITHNQIFNGSILDVIYQTAKL